MKHFESDHRAVYSQSQKRVLATRWVGAAFAHTLRTVDVRAAFVRNGCIQRSHQETYSYYLALAN